MVELRVACEHGKAGHCGAVIGSTTNEATGVITHEFCPGGREPTRDELLAALGAVEIPWCAGHDERWAGAKCFYAMRLQGQQIMPCRLEEPARHYVIGDVSDG